MDTEDQHLLIFKTFSKLIHELSETIGNSYKNVRLYDRLLQKTAVIHKNAINRHINQIEIFCDQNTDAIYAQNHKMFIFTTIKYSENVKLDFNKIFTIIDGDDTKMVWKYLLIINVYLKNTIEAKQQLNNFIKKEEPKKEEPKKEEKKLSDYSEKYKSEDDFLSNMVEKVESNIKEDQNPMETMGSLFSSGVFTELVTDMNNGLKSGDLNIGKLMSSVQSLAQSEGGGGEGMPDIGQMMSNMMGGMANNKSEKLQTISE